MPARWRREIDQGTISQFTLEGTLAPHPMLESQFQSRLQKKTRPKKDRGRVKGIING
jgi:hypothetical protein